MNRFVDVAVIGAGHAGLNAFKEIRRLTHDSLLINGGALGTTAARIGCMPSKVAIHLGDTDQKRTAFDRHGISGASDLQIDQTGAPEHAREHRDTSVDLVLANTTHEMDQQHLIEDFAAFTGPRTLKVGDDVVTANAIIVATGARSVIPEAWRDYAEGILTMDTLFEQASLPESIAVTGLGPIGIEIGQALHRMGVRLVGIEKGATISRLADAGINRAACVILEHEFSLWLGEAPEIQRDGEAFPVRAGGREARSTRSFSPPAGPRTPAGPASIACRSAAIRTACRATIRQPSGSMGCRSISRAMQPAVAPICSGQWSRAGLRTITRFIASRSPSERKHR
ncbi:MAG: FAD-dependent oxidoreductase [Gammaproteobacteria bacterium]